MKVLVVAEIGSNWEGSVTKAKKIIYECKRVGTDAVKFQIWRAKDLYNSSHPNWKNIKKSEYFHLFLFTNFLSSEYLVQDLHFVKV